MASPIPDDAPVTSAVVIKRPLMVPLKYFDVKAGGIYYTFNIIAAFLSLPGQIVSILERGLEKLFLSFAKFKT
jgi:hypothetical protein